MKKMLAGGRIAAIDIGTTKIVVLIATVDSKGRLEVLGIGQHPSYGLKKGVVVNIATTVDSIKAALKEAQSMAGCTIESACVGISGGHIKSFNSTGVVAIKSKEVTQRDIDRVIEAAKAIPLPKDQYILHVLPQYFRVDGQEYVFDSLGMYGVRLEAQVHIVTGAVASAQNIIKCCELAGVNPSDIVLEQIASADAVLTQTERELGVGIIDIGGGTSDFAIYKDGRIRHSKVLPIAGNHFTNDLAVGLGIPLSNAEELKRRYGSVTQYHKFGHHNLAQQKSYLDVPLGYDGGIKTISVDSVSEILHFRAEEVFDLFGDEINEFRLKAFMPAGLVLTGGGALLSGIKDLASEKLDLPVRIGSPESRLGAEHDTIPDILKSPIYATAYGLLVYAIGNRNHAIETNADDPAFSKVFKRMKSWMYDFF